MATLVSIAVIVATAFGTEWLLDSWLGEGLRVWVGLAGVGLLVLAGALVQASEINEITRLLRRAMLGAALRPIGKLLPWLGRRLGGPGNDPAQAERTAPSLRWSGTSEWLLRLGWAGSLIGIGMVWTGVLAG
ncbi:MAG: hypothetical protein J0L76_18270 [Rhodobacterales bacterium]|nr:hypothetical protein [Rhodobacterales bacterium]